jgi:hypothetical protein
MISKAKSNKPKNEASSDGLAAASVVGGNEIYLPITDTAFDIETGPLQSSEGDSLLSAETARVVAIGYYDPATKNILICYDADEAAMLRQFWAAFGSLQSRGAKFLGFNILGFDLPFLMRRSWHHGVAVPKTLMSGGRYWSDTFVDLMIAWRCGGYKDFISLDSLAKFLGVGAKNGNGEMFYLEWQRNRQAAIEYLTNDVKLVIDCAQRMHFCSA